MMNQQQPDKFFREKFQNYQKQAPLAAWDRIESALEKKTNHKMVWWGIAASLILIAGTAYLLWVHNTNTSHTQLTQIGENIKSLQQDTEKTSAEPATESPAESTTTDRKAADGKEATEKKQARKEPRIQESLSQIAEKNLEEKKVIQEARAPEFVNPTVVLNDAPAAKPAKIKMTITADETDKYLNKNALAEATSEEKKPSTLKKLLKKANDLKSNQDPFGDLREKKNEILALNFKNEKRGQNK